MYSNYNAHQLDVTNRRYTYHLNAMHNEMNPNEMEHY